MTKPHPLLRLRQLSMALPAVLVVALAAALPVAVAPGPVAAQDNALHIIGAYTDVEITAGGHDFQLFAKIDTGADSSSIDARDIETFERDDDDWVRFRVPLGEGDEMVEIETPVIDTVGIVGEEDDRPVVEMELCVGEVLMTADVNLADRSELDYRMILGREYLARGGFLVHVAQRGQLRPACEDDD
ncbi:ATP-dependent zinc protease family protein [Mesobaculum littorinae]|uniref:ATP-dependent zinc protease family protein n=1 Tax=Mesobaculum littorinae TaxID=2486419 RepID=UPI0013E34AD4|nr:RimK/LysX family protein [Mesobaculum littorinae]